MADRSLFGGSPLREVLEQAAAALPGGLALYAVEREQLTAIGDGLGGLLGHPREALARFSLDQLRAWVHGDDQRGLEDLLARMKDGVDGEAAGTTLRLRHAGGSWRPLQLRAAVLARDEAERPSLLLLTLTAAEAAAMQADDAPMVLSALLENMPESLTYTGAPPAFPLIAHSRAAHELFGGAPRVSGLASRSDATGLYRPDGSTRPSLEEMPPCRATRDGAAAGEELLLRRADGRTLPLEVAAVPVRRGDAVVGAVSSWRDASERRKLEQALRERAEQLALIVRCTRACWWTWSIDGELMSWSDECRSLFGWPAERKIGREDFLAAVHPADRARVAAAFERARGACQSFDVEYRLVPNGEERWIKVSADCCFDDAGKPLRFFGVMIDITARKRAEVALRESEERFRQLAETVNEIFWVLDPVRRRWIYVSPAYARLFGHEQPDAERWLADVHPEDRERVSRQLAGEAGGRAFSHEYRVCTPTGTRWMRDRGIVRRDAAGQAQRLLGVSEDITERKRLRAGTAARPQAPSRAWLDADLFHTHQALVREVSLLSQAAGEITSAMRFHREAAQRRAAAVDCAPLLEEAAQRVRGPAGERRQTVALESLGGAMPLLGEPERLTDAAAKLLAHVSGYAPAGARITVRSAPRGGVAAVQVVVSADADADAATAAIAAAERLSGPTLDRLLDMEVGRHLAAEAGAMSRLAAGIAEVRRVAELQGGTLTVDGAGDGQFAAFVLRLPLAAAPAPH